MGVWLEKSQRGLIDAVLQCVLFVAVSGCADHVNDPWLFEIAAPRTTARVCLPARSLDGSTVNPEKFCCPVNTPVFFLTNFIKVLSSALFQVRAPLLEIFLHAAAFYYHVLLFFWYLPTFSQMCVWSLTSSYSSALKWK